MRAFAPVLRRNGGGSIANIISASAWFAFRGSNGYHVAKAAAWAATNAARLELAEQGTSVTAVHLRLADTDMDADFLAENPAWRNGILSPGQVAHAVADGIENNAVEILIDDWTRRIKASLADDPAEFYRDQIAQAVLPSQQA